MTECPGREVTPDGTDINIYVPAALVNLGLWAVPLVMPDDVYGDAADELAHWRPVLERLADEIDQCPEGPFVEVRDGDETVEIGLEGRALHVDVDSPTERVSIAVPVSVLHGVVGILPG
jgi:hypothetical protein